MNGLTSEAGAVTAAGVGAAEPIAGSIAATMTPDAAMMRKEDLAKDAIWVPSRLVRGRGRTNRWHGWHSNPGK